MKKTLVALAALSAAGAFAQVTLSGRASMDVSTFQANGGTTAVDYAKRTRVADTSSRITFAANEDLGGGLRAGVYCETGINIDNASSTGQADSNNGNTTSWCSREGRAYFGNDTAEIRLGRQNVWWTQGELNEVGSTWLGSDTLTNLLTTSGAGGVYTTRGENMIKVVAGKNLGAFAGSEVYTAFMGVSGGSGTANTTGGEAAAVASNNSSSNAANSRYNGAKLLYTQGQLVGMFDYQASSNSLRSTTSTAGALGANSFSRSAWKLGAGYKYANESLASVQYWSRKRTDMTGSGATTANPFVVAPNTVAGQVGGNASDTGYGLVVKHDLGNTWKIHGQWGKINNFKDGSGTEVANTGATIYTLGATKHFSKRTHVYASYHIQKNQSAAAFNNGGGNYTSAGTLYQGQDTKIMALGMIHNF
jgi:predicted porin